MDDLEYTGGNTDKQMEFFSKHEDERWLIDLLCQRRRQYPSAGIIGMKWKLVPELLSLSGVKYALRFITDSHDPSVKVIRLRRNPLDVLISRHKHTVADSDPKTKLKAHCRKGDKCIDKWLKASSGLHLPTKYLLKDLHDTVRSEDTVDKFLVRRGVPHLPVTYERLYSGDETAIEEWQNVFEFLGRGPAEGLTIEQLRNSQSTLVTHYAFHNQTLANYEEVRKVLKGTKYQGLLH